MEDELNKAPAAPEDNYWTMTPVAPPVNTSEDIAKGMAAKGTLGVTADVPGTMGGLTQALQSGAGWLGQKAFIDLPNYFGAGLNKDEILADVEYARQKAMEAELSPSEIKDVQEGRRVYAPTQGTYATPMYYEEKTKEALPYTAYEPVTGPGKVLGEAARFGTAAAVQAPIFGPAASTNLMRTGESLLARGLAKAPAAPFIKGMATEGIAGSLAGMGSEAAGEWAKENAPEYEGWARFVGSFAAPAAGKAVVTPLQPWVMPKAFADETALKLLAEDFRDGKSAMTPDQVNQAIADGLEPTVFDLAGPKTRAWLEKNYKISPEVTKNINDLNFELQGRSEGTRSKMRDYLESQFGDVASFDREKLLGKAADTEHDLAWDAVSQNPAAASLALPELSQLVKDSGPFRSAFEVAAKKAKTQGYPSKWGVDFQSKNLPFWQAVKSELDDAIRKNKPNKLTGTGSQSNFAAAVEAKEKLLQVLDNAVPEYGAARDKTSATLGLDNAVDAGEQFAKLKKSEDFNKFIDAYDQYTPDQQELFKRATIRSFYDDLGNKEGSLGSFVQTIKSDKAQKYYRHVFGDQYDSLLGRAVTQQTMDRVKAVEEATSKFLSKAELKETAKTGFLPAAGTAIQMMMNGQNPSMTTLAAAGAALGAVTAKNLALNAGERRIAPRVTALMKSQNPKDLEVLGKLIQETPEAFTFIEKVNQLASRAPLRYVQSQQQIEQKPQESEDYWQMEPATDQILPTGQASGGRVERKSGGRVANSISSEVVRTRALLSNKTASMLSLPDDAIVTALKMAKAK